MTATGPAVSFLHDQTSFREFESLNSKWHGAPVVEHTGKIADLYGLVPLFSRHPFRAGDQENPYKDEIHRDPLTINEDSIPVATVGKTYSLVQHRDVLKSVYRALSLMGIDISQEESTLMLSQYGERMHWRCAIPGIAFDPGDGRPIVLQITCTNSVDTSTALEVAFGWYRLVCGNGMMFGITESHLRRRHVLSLDPTDIAEFLKQQHQRVQSESDLYRYWFQRAVQADTLREWVDSAVTDRWGPHAAARAWSILQTGRDGEVQPAKNAKPHQLRVKPTREVPGSFAPARNLFHSSQVLSWIAGTRQALEERLEYICAIPGLVSGLEQFL